MNGERFEKKLRALSSKACQATGPSVDVSARVQASLLVVATQPRFDLFPIVFCGIAVSVAIAALVFCLPSWHTVVEPWGVYFI